MWSATGGGESPTGLFKQRVNKLANSFTKMTPNLAAAVKGCLDAIEVSCMETRCITHA